MENKELTQSELIKQAIIYLTAAATSFKNAGFDKTAEELLNFSSEALNAFDEIESPAHPGHPGHPAHLDESKLSDKDYDKILSDILNG